MTKTQEDFFNKILCTSHFIARVRKGCVGFYCERGLETEHNCNILTPLLWPSRCVFLVLLMLNRSPRGSLCWVMTLFIASYQHLLWSPNSIGVPSGPLGWVWLYLPHLVYLRPISLELELQLARKTQLNYIIVRRPLDLWNRMFNRHQAEITHAVHRSLSSGASVYECTMGIFSSSHFISQFPPTRFPHITAIRMCHFLLVHHLEWPGQKVKTQHISAVGKTSPTSGYDTKQTDDRAPVMLEFLKMRIITSLPSLPGPRWLEMVAIEGVLSMG